MLNRILDVKPIRPYLLEVTFEGIREALVDVEAELWGPVFEPLKDPEYFMRGRFDAEIRTIVWPNGADLSPEFLLEQPLAARE